MIVLKIGGAALFGSSAFQDSIEQISQTYSSSKIFAIVGGGETIESLRSLHRQYPHLDQARMHWRCIKLLDTTWDVATELLPTWTPIRALSELQVAQSSLGCGRYLVRVSCFYDAESISLADNLDELPRLGWETTSDAIAWYLAKIIQADRIVITKSREIANPATLAGLAEQGIIDPELARLATLHGSTPSRIDFVNLSPIPAK